MTDKNTNDLHNGLLALQEQLNKLDSASQQIEKVKQISATIVEEMAKLQDKYTYHLEALSLENKKLSEEHEKVLKVQFDINKEANQKLISDTEVSLNEINNLVNDSINKSIKIHEQSKQEVSFHLEVLNKENKKRSEEYAKILNDQLNLNKEANLRLIDTTQESIVKISDKLNNNIAESIEIHKKNSNEISSHLNIYSKFLKRVEVLTQTIENVNFPSRLDKLDNSVSAINIGVQNLQTTVSATEKNMSDKIKENKDIFKSEFELSKNQLKSIKKSILIVGVISIVMLIILGLKIFTA